MDHQLNSSVCFSPDLTALSSLYFMYPSDTKIKRRKSSTRDIQACGSLSTSIADCPSR